ncbi:hypothetical protein SCLCIDRAFT_1211855 [Scleroderma citrinum Foug A]|uniref:Uncharacterized protein n=1 Tax=Scleroderma citrinum Foug A TaxID=1036808 RepID=A0A0C3DZ68_9AGAM|nr:hypothetical protein SCLCIDRAFT_1211855 [Scleroderma citrinum Foug A]
MSICVLSAPLSFPFQRLLQVLPFHSPLSQLRSPNQLQRRSWLAVPLIRYFMSLTSSKQRQCYCTTRFKENGYSSTTTNVAQRSTRSQYCPLRYYVLSPSPMPRIA